MLPFGVYDHINIVLNNTLYILNLDGVKVIAAPTVPFREAPADKKGNCILVEYVDAPKEIEETSTKTRFAGMEILDLIR